MKDVMFVCKYGEERVAIQSYSCTSYQNLVQGIRDKWSSLSNAQLRLSYSASGLDKLLLRDSEEFASMLRMASIFNLRYIEINVAAPYDKNDRILDIVSNNICTVTRDKASSSNTMVENDHTLVFSQSANDTPLLSAFWGSCISHIGQGFKGGRIEFRAALAKYAIAIGFEYSYKRNDAENVVAYCKSKLVDPEANCPWYVSATICRANSYFIIRKFVSHHTCEARLNRLESKHLSSNVIAGLITKRLRSKKKTWTANGVAEHLQMSYGQVINYKTSYRALSKANVDVYGTTLESYNDLLWYTRAALDLNPGSKIVLEVDDAKNNFKRIFISWAACIEGFKFLRPMLFLDGTFLTGKFKGCLMAATGKNANNELYPIAYAVVDSENGENWLWFLQCLREVVGFERKIVFISDRNHGLLESLPKVFPESDNFFCKRHLADNLRGRFNGKTYRGLKEGIVTLFSNCVYARTPPEFARRLELFLRDGGKIAADFLLGMPYEKWSNAFSGACRYGEVTSNAAESFNSSIKDEKDFPITKLVDNLREQLMLWFDTRRRKADKWTGKLCKKKETELQALISQGRTWRVNSASALIFEVLSDESHLVHLGARTCTCRDWQIKGFPCAHAVACVNSSRSLRMEDYIEHYWFVDSYRNSYQKPIIPIPSAIKDQYVKKDEKTIQAPLTKRPPGRPKKSRFKTKGERENKNLIRCSRCKTLGHHNKKSCTVPISG